MNFFKRIEGHNKFGEPYFSKLFTAFLETLGYDTLLRFINNQLNIKTIKSIENVEIEEQKQVYFDEISFNIGEINGQPDIGLKIIDEENNKYFIIIEVKRDLYTFSMQENLRKLNLYHTVIQNIPNAYLIGISDRSFDAANYGKFTHFFWQDIFDYFDNDKNIDNYLKRIVNELKEYKNTYGRFMSEFPNDYSTWVANAFIHKQNEVDYRKFQEKLHKFFSEISSIISSSYNGSILPNIYSKSNEVFPIHEVMVIHMPHGLIYDLQFRISRYQPNGDGELIQIISFPLFDDKELTAKIENLLTEEELVHGWQGDGRQEYHVIVGSGDDIRWSDSDWVTKTREKIAVKATKLITKLSIFLNNYETTDNSSVD